MIHNLTLGHLDPDAIAECRAVALCSLDCKVVQQLLDQVGERDHEGLPTVGGLPVQRDNGCVVIRWLVGSFRNRKAEEFAVRLHQRTGCLIADREHGRLIDPAELAGGTKVAS